MKRDVDYARGLVSKAENDWKNVCVSLEHDVPLDTVCFHIQQTAEKLLKALLAFRGVDYPLTHDLKDLLELAVAVSPVLGEFATSLPDYTVYAVALRYDATFYPTREETLAAFENVKRLREVIHSLLPPQARP